MAQKRLKPGHAPLDMSVMVGVGVGAQAAECNLLPSSPTPSSPPSFFLQLLEKETRRKRKTPFRSSNQTNTLRVEDST